MGYTSIILKVLYLNAWLLLRLHCIGSRVVAIIQLYVWVNDWGCVDTLCCSLSHGLGTKLLHNHLVFLQNSCRKD
ncbi:hypothetical protein EB796_023861 [Bugula neritina]|uniref:Uncharacterized protein n=1 Tax=Bugula neritina TaxID=10212 RepID=A0A7J7IW80_BUGNE|nr:hypothetical protein EB796_023861 [Bugula neritina]